MKAPNTGMKTPNTKLQTPEKLQAPSSKLEARAAVWSLELGISLVFGAWFLVFRFRETCGRTKLSPPERFFAGMEPDVLVLPAMSKTRVLVVEAETKVFTELEACLRRVGYDVMGRADTGEAAIRTAKDSRPDVVLMDIGIDGIAQGTDTASYFQRKLKLPVIFLSANSSDTTIFRARDTGPFGFILTPCDERELKVAIEMAVFRHRMEMEREALIHQLEAALAQVNALSGLLPICAECKKVRDDGGYWSQVETYIEQRTEARFSHGLCPICFDTAMARHHEDSGHRCAGKPNKAAQGFHAPGVKASSHLFS
jgi:two-component system, response regulator PdtaR